MSLPNFDEYGGWAMDVTVHHTHPEGKALLTQKGCAFVLNWRAHPLVSGWNRGVIPCGGHFKKFTTGSRISESMSPLQQPKPRTRHLHSQLPRTAKYHKYSQIQHQKQEVSTQPVPLLGTRGSDFAFVIWRLGVLSSLSSSQSPRKTWRLKHGYSKGFDGPCLRHLNEINTN